MRPFKVLHVAPDHVVVDDGDGRPFKVATSHRHVATVQKLLKMAEGGEVENKAVSAASDSPDQQYFRDWQQNVTSPFLANVADLPIQELGGTTANDLAERSGYPRGGVSANAIGVVRTTGQPPDGATPAPTPTPAPDVPPMLAAPTPQPADVPLPGLPSGRGPPVPGTAEQLAGVKAKGAAEAGFGTAQADIIGRAQQQRDALAAGLQKDYADNQARQDAISADILNGKIEPNRLWHNMGTGQKVSAVIGMILGGIGAGMTHGPNYAAQVIDKAIDRDMEAQKIDLGKKQSQLGYYLQRGHNLQQSYMLAKADAMDRTAAQIQAAQGQFGGQIAQANAQQSAGLIKQNASMLRQQAYGQTLQNQERQISMQAQQYQMQVTRQLMQGVSGGGGFDRRMLEMPGMDKYRERAVDLPDGSIGFATTKEEAAKATEAFMAAAKLKEKVAGYRQLLEKGSPVTMDRSAAHAMRADILAEMGHLHGLNRLSDKDLSLFEQQVPDITDVIKPNAGKVLGKLGDSIMDASWTEQQRFLNIPRNKRPPRSR